jgi:integrase
MAVPKEYTESNVDGLRGLRANKKFTKFYYRFKILGREYTFLQDFSNSTWTPKDRKSNARKEAEKYKEQKYTDLENPFNPSTKFDYIANEYFSKKCPTNNLSKSELKKIENMKISKELKDKLKYTKWTLARIRLYELYIQPFIGNKKASAVIENDIDKIRKHMETKGYSKQNENGNSIRSIKKVLLQVLKPLLEYADSNGALTKKIPPINIPKSYKERKKSVTNGSEKIALLYHSILERYKEDPFYRALFLFALFGRRWNEIATLRWEHINFRDNNYTITAEHNKIGIDQSYDLPQPIKEPLMQFQDKEGLIFKSPVTGAKLYTPRKQLAKLKEDTGIEELTMHYFRHILVTALGETGTTATVLSASLGHIRGDTVDKHYRSINHLRGSRDANEQLENILDVEVIK